MKGVRANEIETTMKNSRVYVHSPNRLLIIDLRALQLAAVIDVD